MKHLRLNDGSANAPDLCSLFPIPYFLFPIPYSLLPIPFTGHGSVKSRKHQYAPDVWACVLGLKMKIIVAADHVGFGLKEKALEYLKSRGVEVEDCGPSNAEPVDYPDFAEKVAARVAAKQADYGVLVCGTGIGMMLAANKVGGVRAVAANDTISARLAREHNDANVLTLGARMIDAATMRQIVDTWLSTPFAGGRHERRLRKIETLEQRYHAEKKP